MLTTHTVRLIGAAAATSSSVQIQGGQGFRQGHESLPFPFSTSFSRAAACLGAQRPESPPFEVPRQPLYVENPLYAACSNGDVESVKNLLKQSHDPRKPGQVLFSSTSFHAAFLSQNPANVLAVLLAYEARKCI